MANDPYTHPFLIADSLAEYAVPRETYIAQRPQYQHLALGALLFHKSTILLVQRAADESFPNCWETPGGGCENGTIDKTILHGVARELLEETGLLTSSATSATGSISETSGSIRPLDNPEANIPVTQSESVGTTLSATSIESASTNVNTIIQTTVIETTVLSSTVSIIIQDMSTILTTIINTVRTSFAQTVSSVSTEVLTVTNTVTVPRLVTVIQTVPHHCRDP